MLSRRVESENDYSRLSRREFLRLLGATVGAVIISSCTPKKSPENGSESLEGHDTTIGLDIYEAFPELRKLDQRQSKVIEIKGTRLETLNLSDRDVNFQAIAEVYSYVNRLASQIEENGWYYKNVNYSYNNQPHRLDIHIRPSIAEKRGLVLLSADQEIPELNMPDVRGATIYSPFEITFLRIPVSANPEIVKLVPNYNNEVASIHGLMVEVCQASVYVSSPQDTIPRSFIAQEIFCNSLGWHVALAQAGLSVDQARSFIASIQSDAAGIVFNPIPPHPELYSQIPKFRNLFDR